MKRWLLGVGLLAALLVLGAKAKDVDPPDIDAADVTEIVPPIAGDNQTDDAPAIQNAINNAPPGSQVKFPYGKKIKINSGITTTTNVGIDFNGSCFNTSGLSGHSAALTISSVVPGANYDGNEVSYRKICLKGPGPSDPGWGNYGNGTVGLLLAASNFDMEGWNIQGYNEGVSYGSNAYGISVFDPTVLNNKWGMAFHYPTPSNSGEQLSFFGGSISNNTTGIQADGSTELNFTGTSFDYNGTHFFNIGGPIRLEQVHIEGMYNPPFVWPVDGPSQYSHLLVRDSDIVSGGTGLVSFPLISANDSSGAYAEFQDDFLSGFTQDPTDFSKWCTGSGCVSVDMCRVKNSGPTLFSKIGPFGTC